MKGRIYTWSDALGYYADIHGEICHADEVVEASHAREMIGALGDKIERLRQRCAEHEQFRHQHRDCDSMGVELQRLREALIRVRAHTGYQAWADRELLAGLLATIERITDAALGAADQPDAGRAYHETHEPPHCPTCECWQEITPDNSGAAK